MCERTYPITEDELLAKYNALVLKSKKNTAKIQALRKEMNNLLAALEAVSNANMYPGGADPFYAISEEDMDAARAAIASVKAKGL